MAAPKKNKFATKPASERANSLLSVRARRVDVAAWNRAAKRAGEKLPEWVRTRLNEAAKPACNTS